MDVDHGRGARRRAEARVSLLVHVLQKSTTEDMQLCAALVAVRERRSHDPLFHRAADEKAGGGFLARFDRVRARELLRLESAEIAKRYFRTGAGPRNRP